MNIEPAIGLTPGLYIIATPIGNLGDITLRALQTLKAVDRIYAEDTRVTRTLLSAYGINTPLDMYHDFSTDATRQKILAEIQQGGKIALVSDAGTPLISDPGYKLIRCLQEAHLPVQSLPGPSACITALTVAGLPPHPFLFAGFLPPKSGPRQSWFREHCHIPATIVLYESARRLPTVLAELCTYFPHHEVAVVRELTKRFEEVKRGSAQSLHAYYTAHPPRGEIVILIGPVPETARDASTLAVEQALIAALATMSVRDAAHTVAECYRLPKRDIYRLALSFSK